MQKEEKTQEFTQEFALIFTNHDGSAFSEPILMRLTEGLIPEIIVYTVAGEDRPFYFMFYGKKSSPDVFGTVTTSLVYVVADRVGFLQLDRPPSAKPPTVN